MLNAEYLEELREIMAGDFDGLMQTFLTESAKQYRRIRVAWSAGTPEDLHRAAHSLKGSSGTLGIRRMAVLSEALEGHCRGEAMEQAASTLEELEEAFVHVRQALEVMQKQHVHSQEFTTASPSPHPGRA